jgi:RNA polymerase sigma-70 factor, ECF subfamily
MDDEKAIQAARQGDVAAFNQLVLAYQGVAYNLAYRILGDREAAADVTQDSFLKAYQALGRYRGGSFRSWLLQIVANACYDNLRWKRRHPSSSLSPEDPETGCDPDYDHRLVARTESPCEYVMRQELAQAIQASILKLPDDQRTALVLCDVEGLGYLEIARITRTNLGTVKSRIARGRARLRDLLLAHRESLSGVWPRQVVA